MDGNHLAEAMRRVLGKEDVLSSPRDRLVYSHDAVAGTTQPDMVLFPRTASEVSQVMSLASLHRIPVVPRGAGTNLSGGVLPLAGGIVMSLTRMNGTRLVDTDNERAVVEPGVVNLDLQNALSPFGFLYAPDPSSQKVATMGGNVAENAGGPHCLKYGVTTNHVYGLEVVLADGEVIQTGGIVEDSPGYDLTGLLVGSEGTLGVVTSATVRLIRGPEAIKTMLAAFLRLEDAGDAVSQMISEGIIPATLEIMDKTSLEALEQCGKGGYPVDAEAVLLIELDGLADGQDRQAERVAEICRHRNARDVKIARNEAERDVLWVGRRACYSVLVSLAPGSSIHDLTVPRTRLSETFRRVFDIAAKYRVRIGAAAHAGDGNLHPLMVFDPRDEDEVARVHLADKEIIRLCAEMDGAITGEHGVGIDKRAYMSMVFDDLQLELMRQMKRAFDPLGILNPGKVIPPKED